MYFLNSLHYASNPHYENESRMLPATAKVCRHFTSHQDEPSSPYTDITFADRQVQVSHLWRTTWNLCPYNARDVGGKKKNIDLYKTDGTHKSQAISEL